MVNIIKAEHQKAKRTMRKKFIWGFPLLTFVMAFIFTLGMTNAYAESVWNWIFGYRDLGGLYLRGVHGSGRKGSGAYAATLARDIRGNGTA